MSDNLFKKSLLTGLGLALVSKQKIEQMIKDVAKDNNISQKESEKMARQMLDKISAKRQDAEKNFESMVEKILKKLQIPSRREFDDLKRQVAKTNTVKSKKPAGRA